MAKLLNRTDRSALAEWWWTVDRRMVIALMILIGFGVMMVSAASPSVASRIGLGDFHFIIRHFIFLVPSMVIIFGISMMRPRYIKRLGVLLFIGAIIGLIMTLAVGTEIKGAQRWIRVLGFSVQPSEFLKPAFIVMAAWLMAQQKHNPAFPGNSVTAGLFVLSVILLVMQPDMGMTFLLTVIWGAQVFLAGFPFFLMGVLGGLAVLGLVAAYFLLPHFQSRLNRFFDPESGDTYQIDKAMEAFSSGGLTGVGAGQGDVKLTIPDAHADFVFAVAGEELGLIALLFLIGLYGFILWRGFAALRASNDMFTVLAIGGLLTMFGVQSFIHMGSNTHILPTKGMTLPFVSYGGSSMIALAIGMGMLLGLTRRRG